MRRVRWRSGSAILPVIGGIASLWLPERFSDPAYRAFAAYLLASICALGLYTAAKATYLLSSLRPAIEERNLFFLSPLLLIGTALVLSARKVSWPLVGVATVLVMVTVWSGMFEVGRAVLRGTRARDPDARQPRLPLGRERLPPCCSASRRSCRSSLLDRCVTGAASAFWRPCCWARGCSPARSTQRSATPTTANSFAKKIPAPRDWVDQGDRRRARHVPRAVGDRRDPALADRVLEPLAQPRREPERRCPGPGPDQRAGARDDRRRALRLHGRSATRWRGTGCSSRRRSSLRGRGFVLYRTPKRWHLLDEEQNVFADGWATSPIGYTYFPRGGPGTVVVVLSRTGYRGPGQAGRSRRSGSAR